MSFYQRNQAWIIYIVSLIFLTLISLGIMFLYHFRTIMRCIGLFCLMLLLTPLPACQVLKEGKPQNYLLDIAKSITKSNLQKLFPDAHFERDSIQVGKAFEQAFLRKVFASKVRHFLTPKGNITAQTLDFYADISWERTGEQVRITLYYYKKKGTASTTGTHRRARDGLAKYV